MKNYYFDEEHLSYFNKILPLINYDFKVNKVQLEIDSIIFLDYHNKIYNNYTDLDNEERVKSTLNFYSYILEKNLAKSFNDIYEHILHNKPWMFINPQIKIFFNNFSNNNIAILFYVNTLIKSLINSSYYRKTFYEESGDITQANFWFNSTTVLENQLILIKNFVIYNELDINIPFNNNIFISNLFKFISYLIDKGFIKEVKKSFFNNKKMKTIKFWSVIEYINPSFLPKETNFSLVPYSTYEYFDGIYEKGVHFSKVIPLCRKNWYSGEIFNFKNKEYLNKILGLKLYVDTNFLEEVLNIIEKKENISLEKLEKLIYEESYKLKEVFNEVKINKNLADDIKILQKSIAKKIDLLRIREMSVKKDDRPNYLPIFFDFRGRNYFDDYISPTFSRIMRLSLFYGYYSKKDIEKVNLDFINNFIDKEIMEFIDKTIEKMELKKEDYVINAVFWLLISIGKFSAKNKVETHLKEFIEKGYNTLITNELNLEIKDYIEVTHYIKIIKSLKEDSLKKKIVLKDATASVIQNLIRILGPKDQESLNLANLGNPTTWYDPYTYIIDMFTRSLIDKKEYAKFFTRKTTKKTIMTNPYSAGKKTCWKYFIKEVKKNFDNEPINEENLQEIFNIFHDFVSDFFEEMHIFKNSSKNLIDYFWEIAKKENKIILSIDDSSTNLVYFKHKIHYIDIINEKGVRITKKIKKVDYSKLNYRKIYTSIRANIAHWLDAIFLRRLVNKLIYPIFTIHDEFAIDFLNIDELILNANIIANEDLKIDLPWNYTHKFKIFSMFILL